MSTATLSDDAELADRMLLAVVEAWPTLSATRRMMIVAFLSGQPLQPRA